MMLLTKEILRKLPPLYANESVKDPLAIVKFLFRRLHGWPGDVAFERNENYRGWEISADGYRIPEATAERLPEDDVCFYCNTRHRMGECQFIGR